MGVLILNDSNNMYQFNNIKEIGKGLINEFCLHQIGIIRVNGDERNTIRGSKRRLLCHTRMASTTVVDTLTISNPSY